MPAPLGPYAPTAGSLSDRVCCWFRANREEELRSSDIARKFDVPVTNVGASLEAPLAHGLLLLRKDDDGARVWAAGPRLFLQEAAADTMPARRRRRPVPTAAAEPQPRQPMPAPPAGITIDTDVPMPISTAAISAQWAQVFAQMDIGHSIVAPAGQSRTLSMMARRWTETTGNGRRYKVMRMQDGQSRLFRVE